MQRMTLAEKIRLVHGAGSLGFTPTDTSIVRSNGGDGFVPGIPRLGIPDLNMSGSSAGVTNTHCKGRYSTALPSTLALASSWDVKLGQLYGSLIGAELACEGFNVFLGGGVNLVRDPRDGRAFEYLGEDPILAGTMAARITDGIQSHHIIGDVKHFAVNDQETGRGFADAIIGRRALQETDLLAFQIAIKQAQPGIVMCAYNLVNGIYSCQNRYLLNEVLKGDWGFKGWVVSDWGATHSTVRAVLAGLDMQMPDARFFGTKLQEAVQSGLVPVARLNEMVHRILRTEFASGLIDHPPIPCVPDIFYGFRIAQRVEEESAVLLKNLGVLPLDASKLTSIAVIGSHADVGVLSGGGSSQVDPPGGNAVPVKVPSFPEIRAQMRAALSAKQPLPTYLIPTWDPSSPFRAIRAHAPHARVIYDSGLEPALAAKVAERAQVAIVFLHQYMAEGMDVPSLKLSGDQDKLVAAVAASNPRTVVVLETGGPVEMPWANKVAGILEAWYPGIRGGQAIADLLFGTANPSGKLPITFPRSDSQLPRPVMPEPPPTDGLFKLQRAFAVRYGEGIAVGYKWFDVQGVQPLFTFGYGLSYSHFVYTQLTAQRHERGLDVRFVVRNVSSRAGAEVAQAYLTFPKSANEPPKRLIGWNRVLLQPGQQIAVTLQIPSLYLSIFDTHENRWRIAPGKYRVLVGSSSHDLPLSAAIDLP